MAVSFTHPSRRKLREWLAALAPADKVTVHVETCERCASRLLDLADKQGNGVDKATDEALLAQTVKTEWLPPADLTERVIKRIDEREHNERDLTVMLGLFGIAAETVSLMLEPGEGDLDAPQGPVDEAGSDEPDEGTNR